MVIKEGCQRFATDPKACKRTIREDGPYIEVAEHENVVVQKLGLRPQSIGFLSYGFYHQNPNKVKALSIDGVLPTRQTISDRTYPLVRPLYIYVKAESLKNKPDIQVFLDELFSEDAMGNHGYLTERGLISVTGVPVCQ